MPSFQHLRTFYAILTWSADSSGDPGRYRQSQLLASVLLFFIPLTILLGITSGLWIPLRSFLQNVEFFIALILGVFLIIAYGLNRAGRYEPAAALTVGAFDAAVFAVAVLNLRAATPYASGDPHLLIYLVVPILFGGMLLSLRTQVVMITFNTVGMLLVPAIISQPNPVDFVVGPLSFVLMVSAFMLMVTHHRNQVEIARQADLTEREERYRSLFQDSRSVMLLTDPQTGAVVDANPAACAYYGYNRDELTHMKIQDINTLPEDQVFRAMHQAAAEEQTSFNFQHRLADGCVRDVRVDRGPVRIQGRLLLASIIHDITAQKQAEEALQRSNLELRAQNEELDAFAHTVAHDLKGPLAIVVGMADLLLEGRDAAAEDTEHLKTISQVGHKMSRIIDELLLFAQIRQADVALEPLDMGRIVVQALQRVSALAMDAQAELVVPDIWPIAMGYGPWIEEVWINYLSNAIKYGGCPPRVELGATVQSDGMVCFWVRDNGLGLTSEQQAQLFTPFNQLTDVRATGHGLGLSIVRRIVERLDGQVGVQSPTDARPGSTFSFTLPGSSRVDGA